jgi:hypothetical protein
MKTPRPNQTGMKKGMELDRLYWIWVIVALGSHTGFGAHPVLSRYLQTVSDLPSMALLSCANGLVIVLSIKFILAHVNLNLLYSQFTWMLAGIIAIRGVTNIFASYLTTAIHVQVIALTTPFLALQRRITWSVSQLYAINRQYEHVSY